MSNKNNKWENLAAPPSPLFFGKKERDFVKQTTDQLVECVIGQNVIYYPIDTDKSNFHPLYGEALNKIFSSPIHIYVLVEWKGQQTDTTNYGIDRKSSPIVVHFHTRRLVDDQDLFVREGDFIYYNSEYWEIVNLIEPRLMFGQDDFKVEISADCIRAREENFNGKT